MSNYLKPQTPLFSKKNNAFIYPLTTSDQVIMPDGSRLTPDKLETMILETATPENIGALSMELLWENASDFSHFAAQTLTFESLTQYSAVYIVYTQMNVPTKFIEHKYIPRKYNDISCGLHGIRYDSAPYVVYRGIITNFDAGTIIFSEGTQNGTAGNNYIIPVQIYGIKGVSK